MKNLLAVLAMVGLLAGCAQQLTMDKSGFLDDMTGRYYTVMVARDTDRLGTEAKHLIVTDDTGKVVSNGTVGGRGIIAGMTDGALPALIQSGGLIGMGTLISPTKINNNNTGSNQSQGQGQFQKQGQAQLQKQGQGIKSNISNLNTNANTNLNSNINTNTLKNTSMNTNTNIPTNVNSNSQSFSIIISTIIIQWLALVRGLKLSIISIVPPV